MPQVEGVVQPHVATGCCPLPGDYEGKGGRTGMKDRVSILGTEYTVQTVSYEDDMRFSKYECSGYCSVSTHRIVLCDMRTFPEWDVEPDEVIAAQQRSTLRHEIVHAFLAESGLDTNTNITAGPWARDEEIVDWIARQGEKIWKAWAEVGALGANAPIPHPERYTDSDVEEAEENGD